MKTHQWCSLVTSTIVHNNNSVVKDKEEGGGGWCVEREREKREINGGRWDPKDENDLEMTMVTQWLNIDDEKKEEKEEGKVTISYFTDKCYLLIFIDKHLSLYLRSS